MSLDFTDDQSTLFQVMAWCCQATSHYLSQCWLRSLSQYGVTRPQWVNWKLGSKFWRNFDKNTTIFIQEKCIGKSGLQISSHFVLILPLCAMQYYKYKVMLAGALTACHLWHRLTLIPAWISNYMPRKVWDEITGLALGCWDFKCHLHEILS